jgi:hypothetical protein
MKNDDRTANKVVSSEIKMKEMEKTSERDTSNRNESVSVKESNESMERRKHSSFTNITKWPVLSTTNQPSTYNLPKNRKIFGFPLLCCTYFAAIYSLVSVFYF